LQTVTQDLRVSIGLRKGKVHGVIVAIEFVVKLKTVIVLRSLLFVKVLRILIFLVVVLLRVSPCLAIFLSARDSGLHILQVVKRLPFFLCLCLDEYSLFETCGAGLCEVHDLERKLLGFASVAHSEVEPLLMAFRVRVHLHVQSVDGGRGAVGLKDVA
jgi:hypothetical protein